MIIIWNDNDPLTGLTSEGFSKAVLAMNYSNNQGFYLAHSMSGYPNISDGRINISVPDSANIYGQSFLCMSLNSTNLEKFAENLAITKPNTYFQ